MSPNEDIQTVLGKKVSYSAKYNPSILVREKRSKNRIQYNIDDNNLKFVGFDNWNCYEISFLLDNGYPVSGIARIIYPCNNKYLVESKSLKLYLNSLNMEKFGSSSAAAITSVKGVIKQDLEELLVTNVQVDIFIESKSNRFLWTKFSDINSLIDGPSLQIIHYDESPALLRGHKNIGGTDLLVSIPYLRSNCKITSQPDWGTAFIQYRGPYLIDLESLAQYVISFRNENHFHEEVCEMLYTRLFKKFEPTALLVACCYTRRGGIDICPVRASDLTLIPDELKESKYFYGKLLQQ